MGEHCPFAPAGDHIEVVRPVIGVLIDPVGDALIAVLFDKALKRRFRNAKGYSILCGQNTVIFLCKFIKQFIVFHIYHSFYASIIIYISI